MTTITIERELLEKVREALWQMTKQFNFGRLHESRLRDSEARVAAHDAMKALEEALSAPATAPEPIQLRQGECWPESTMAQWDYYRKLIAEGDTSSAPRDWFESLAEMRLIAAPATAPEQPSWHDAPNAPGLWVCRQAYTGNMQAFEVTDPDALNRTLGIEGRWFGPVPPDSGDKPR